jgi:hypothetical protein
VSIKATETTTIEVEPVDGYVWCDAHGSIHDDRPDPYDEGLNCEKCHHPVYVEKADL